VKLRSAPLIVAHVQIVLQERSDWGQWDVEIWTCTHKWTYRSTNSFCVANWTQK